MDALERMEAKYELLLEDFMELQRITIDLRLELQAAQREANELRAVPNMVSGCSEVVKIAR